MVVLPPAFNNMVLSITLFQHTAREQVLLLSNEEVTLTVYTYGLVRQVVLCSCNHCKPHALWHAHRYLRLAVVPDSTPLPMTTLSKLWRLSGEREAEACANLLQQLGIMRVAFLYDGSAWALVDGAHLKHLQVSCAVQLCKHLCNQAL